MFLYHQCKCWQSKKGKCLSIGIKTVLITKNPWNRLRDLKRGLMDHPRTPGIVQKAKVLKYFSSIPYPHLSSNHFQQYGTQPFNTHTCIHVFGKNVITICIILKLCLLRLMSRSTLFFNKYMIFHNLIPQIINLLNHFPLLGIQAISLKIVQSVSLCKYLWWVNSGAILIIKNLFNNS